MRLNDDELAAIIKTIAVSAACEPSQDDDTFRKLVSRCVSESLCGRKFSLMEKQGISEYVFSRLRGYDLLQPLMDNPLVTEIMVNGADNIFYEENGKINKYTCSFESKKHLYDTISRIFAAQNRSLNDSDPIGDVRLQDGSRANAALSSIAPDGPILTIRKFTGIRPDMTSLIDNGFLSESGAIYLSECVKSKKNIFISGGTGTGKTTFLNVLSGFIPLTERIITIEDSSELKLQNTPNLVRLITRPPYPDGSGEITMTDLIRCALRMRPDRIIVGEVRGREATDMLWAMNTGHMGSLCTGHGNSAMDMLMRISIMIRESSMLPIDIICSMLALAIDVVIHLKRSSVGSRQVDEIINVSGYSDGVFTIKSVYSAGNMLGGF